MANRGNGEWTRAKEIYTPNQVAATIRSCGIDIEGETSNDFICFCPFHENVHSPSFSVSRNSGVFICFNHSCGVTGTLVDLVKKMPLKDGSHRGEFEARRFILKKRSETEQAYIEQTKKTVQGPLDFVEFPQKTIDRMHTDFWENPEAVRYMVEERGIEEETLEFFSVGYSAKKDIIAVPMHSPQGLPVGVIGRPASKDDKFFKNSRGLPTSKTLWNIHRAKKHGETVIITEASFDGMRVHQAGYPNVVSCLGGNFSVHHFDLISRHFDKIIIMTDFDQSSKYIYNNCYKCKRRGFNLCMGHNPGRDLGATIAAGLRNKSVYWASYDEGIVYPNNSKDAGEMTDDEIRQCLKNAVPNFRYISWNLY